MTKKKLEVGERVWVETLSYAFTGIDLDQRCAEEYEVVESNGTSAYVVRLDLLDRYNENTKNTGRVSKYLRLRVNQRTFGVDGGLTGSSYRLWKTKKEFCDAMKYAKEKRDVKREVIELVNDLALKDLKKIIKDYSK